MADYKEEDIEFYQKAKRDFLYIMDNAHFHNRNEIYYLEKGMVKYFVENETFILNPGDLIFIPKGVFHKTSMFEKIPVERSLLVFENSFLGDDFLYLTDKIKKQKIIHIKANYQSKIHDIFSEIEFEDSHRDNNYVEVEKMLLRKLLIYINRYMSDYVDYPKNQTSEIINMATRYISKNCNEDLSLEALSKKYALSPSYFSKCFKNITGIGLNEYINIAKITYGEELLKTKKYSVTEVAIKCGFNDGNYFASVFKRLKGISPKKYMMKK